MLACSEKNFHYVLKSSEEGNILQKQEGKKQEENWNKESFVLLPDRRKLDIVFVVDNSISMYEMQKNLSKRLNSFLSSLGSVDWRIGVITTDMRKQDALYQEGRLIEISSQNKFIDSSMTNYNKLFKQTIKRREHGSSYEYPITALLKSMEKKEDDNQGFFREGSYVVAILLTNEDEYKDSTVEPSDLVTFFNENMNLHNGLRVYGISIIPDDEECLKQQDSGSGYGIKVAELVRLTGGKNISICSENYGPGLQGISTDAYHFMSLTLTLKERPSKEKDIQVFLSPSNEPVLFSLNGKEVAILSQLPQQASVTLEVRYPTNPKNNLK